MIRRPPRSTPLYSSAASDVYKRQLPRYMKSETASTWFPLTDIVLGWGPDPRFWVLVFGHETWRPSTDAVSEKLERHVAAEAGDSTRIIQCRPCLKPFTFTGYPVHILLRVLSFIQDTKLLSALLDVIAQPYQYFKSANASETAVLPESFDRLLCSKVERFFS